MVVYRWFVFKQSGLSSLPVVARVSRTRVKFMAPTSHRREKEHPSKHTEVVIPKEIEMKRKTRKRGHIGIVVFVAISQTQQRRASLDPKNNNSKRNVCSVV